MADEKKLGGMLPHNWRLIAQKDMDAIYIELAKDNSMPEEWRLRMGLKGIRLLVRLNNNAELQRLLDGNELPEKLNTLIEGYLKIKRMIDYKSNLTGQFGNRDRTIRSAKQICTVA